MPLIPALERQRQEEFEASLFYRVSSRIARATQRNPVLKKQTANPNPKRQNRPDGPKTSYTMWGDSKQTLCLLHWIHFKP